MNTTPRLFMYISRNATCLLFIVIFSIGMLGQAMYYLLSIALQSRTDLPDHSLPTDTLSMLVIQYFPLVVMTPKRP
jgi:hypothetical protein